MKSLFGRARNKARRLLASRLHRRDLPVTLPVPIVSFTFDDAPRTAFERGARVLERHGVRGTYFVSLGLLSTLSDTGPIASPDDLASALERGHELGCHTYDHCDAWEVPAARYLASVDANRRALEALLPGAAFRTFAYPKNGATHRVKAELARRFDCCRGGGQGNNAGSVDLNLVNGCFIDRRARVELEALRALIDENARRRGWLVFAAHDISPAPDHFSCSEERLDALVQYALGSGSEVLPVVAACARLRAAANAARC